MIESLTLFGGLILGAALAWFFTRGNREKLSLLEQKAQELEQLNLRATVLETEKRETEKRLLAQQDIYNSLDKELREEREKSLKYKERVDKAEEFFKYQNERIETQKKELEELNKKLQADFENIANRLLEEKSQKFTEQNRNNLDSILKPLQERIKEFEEKVDKTYKAESGERITLKTEIKQLMELNQTLQKEANDLTSALKGNNKAQGNWGELILERVLEMSGLQKEREYKTQFSTSGTDGNVLRPDVLVMLPDNKHIIIDSKVSLVAYDSWASAETEEEREKYIKQHIDSIKTHIKQLSEKNYQASRDFNTPDMVLLFMPIEPAFAAAVQHDQDLYSFAWEKKIVIVSPSTLLATLRTISSIWQQDRQVKNALEIARQGGELYDKFAGFIESLEKIGKAIQNAEGHYDEAYKKLKSGTGNLVSRAKKLQELGAKTSKSLPSNMDSEEEENV